MALAGLPNAVDNPISGASYRALVPGQTAFVSATKQTYAITNVGTEGGGDAVWLLQATSATTPGEIAIESFDPGPQDPLRWNTAFDAATAHAAQNGTFTLVFLAGTYAFTRQVVLTKTLSVKGAGPGGTIIQFSTVGNAGFWIQLTASFSRFSGFTLNGPNPWLGADVGFLVNSPFVKFMQLAINNWSAQGVRTFGNVPVSNANGTGGVDVTLNLCGHGGAPAGDPNPLGAGLYLDSGDANGGVFTGWSFFDCRKGVYESSFLGNAFVGCLAEGCNNKFDVPLVELIGTGFETDDPNCRATFIGCYTEGDSPGRVNFPSTIFGGFFGNLGTAVQINSSGGVQKLAALHAYIDPNVPPAPVPTDPNRITISALGGTQPGDAFTIFVYDATTGQNVYLTQSLRFNQSALGWWAFNYGNVAGWDAYRFREKSFWIPYDLQRGLKHGADRGMREAVVVSAAAAIADGPSDGGAWAVGDRLIIAAPLKGQPSRYCCTAAGPAAEFTVESTLAP